MEETEVITVKQLGQIAIARAVDRGRPESLIDGMIYAYYHTFLVDKKEDEV